MRWFCCIEGFPLAQKWPVGELAESKVYQLEHI